MRRRSATPTLQRSSPDAPKLNKPESILDLANYCLTRISDLAGSQVTRVCEGEFGITRREWRFIALLAAFGELSPSALAVHATLDRPTTSKALTSLSLKGLVRRSRAACGGCHFTIQLTEAGRHLHAQVFPRSVAINLALIEPLSKAQCATLARLLAILQVRAEEIARPDPAQVRTDRRQGGSRARWQRTRRALADG